MRRVCRDNQRVEVDVGGEGKWVVSGSQDERVRLWDLTVAGDAETGEVKPAGEWVGVEKGEGGGVVNGVALHPGWAEGGPYVATVSGCRAFPAYEDSDSEDEGRRERESTPPSLVSRLSLWRVEAKEISVAGSAQADARGTVGV